MNFIGCVLEFDLDMHTGRCLDFWREFHRGNLSSTGYEQDIACSASVRLPTQRYRYYLRAASCTRPHEFVVFRNKLLLLSFLNRITDPLLFCICMFSIISTKTSWPGIAWRVRYDLVERRAGLGHSVIVRVIRENLCV